MSSAIVPIRGNYKVLDKAERSQLVEIYGQYKAMSNEWIRRQVIENNRIDILCGVLGYTVKPFHLAMMRWQFLHPENLQLVFRGAGKSTICTVTKTIHLLLKNPNLRILLASKTSGHAESMLKEIKAHFESNDRLAEIFGEYYDPRRVNKWDNCEIEVLPRTVIAKEASVTCIGVGGQVVGKHYDILIPDDLVDEDNSRTKYMREKAKSWYYQSLDPTLEPPDPSVPHRGERHCSGTRYHFDDLYGHLLSNELAEHVQIIKALDKFGRSPWPDKFPPEWFAEKRKRSGIIIFNAQFQNDTEAMKGEIFQYDDCQQISAFPDPSDLAIFMGVDLAIEQKETADKFAIVVIGMDVAKNYYVLDYYENRIRFGTQTKKIIQYHKKWDPIRCGIEVNAYQKAQYQTLKDSKEGPNLRLKPITTDTDKIVRAWKLSALFEDKRMFFLRGKMDLLIEHLVLFPNYDYKDLFDALDIAVSASRVRKRKRRRTEPGVI